MKQYYGKNSWWVLLIFIAYNILPFPIAFRESDIPRNVFSILIIILYYAFNIIWIPILVRNRIEVFENYFIFYYGFSKKRVYLKDIITIEKSRDWISSSANSLDRIHIVTKEEDFCIALKENDEFLNEVITRLI